MNPLSLLPASYRLLAAAVVTMLVLGASYGLGRSHGGAAVHAKWDAEKVVQIQAAIEADKQAREKERAMNDQLQKAQNDAKKREALLRADADTARAAVAGLRYDIDTARANLPGDSVEACRATAHAALTVFGQCAERYQRVAEAADGHASDARLLSESWPE